MNVLNFFQVIYRSIINFYIWIKVISYIIFVAKQYNPNKKEKLYLNNLKKKYSNDLLLFRAYIFDCINKPITLWFLFREFFLFIFFISPILYSLIFLRFFYNRLIIYLFLLMDYIFLDELFSKSRENIKKYIYIRDILFFILHTFWFQYIWDKFSQLREHYSLYNLVHRRVMKLVKFIKFLVRCEAAIIDFFLLIKHRGIPWSVIYWNRFIKTMKWLIFNFPVIAKNWTYQTSILIILNTDWYIRVIWILFLDFIKNLFIFKDRSIIRRFFYPIFNSFISVFYINFCFYFLKLKLFLYIKFDNIKKIILFSFYTYNIKSSLSYFYNLYYNFVYVIGMWLVSSISKNRFIYFISFVAKKKLFKDRKILTFLSLNKDFVIQKLSLIKFLKINANVDIIKYPTEIKTFSVISYKLFSFFCRVFVILMKLITIFILLLIIIIFISIFFI